MVGAGWRGAQGRPPRVPELHRVRARERDRLPHLHGDGARSVCRPLLHHAARADAEAAAGGAAQLAQGRVPVLSAERSIPRLRRAMIVGADVAPDRYEEPKGFSMSLHIKSTADGERIFRELAKDGRVVLPLEKTFWSA